MRFVRSFLFVPGNREHMIQKARTLSCGSVILDLEDSVGEAEKALALGQVKAALADRAGFPMQVAVRINPGSMEHEIGALSGLPFDAVVFPKAEALSTARLLECLQDHQMAADVIVIIETPRGLVDCFQTLQLSGKIVGALLGAEDFTADMGLQRTPEGGEIAYARTKIALECLALGKLPIDTPCVFIQELAKLADDIRIGRSLGMKAKAAIHPSQLAYIEQGFAPDGKSLERARAIVDIYAKNQGNAFQFAGEMIDKPIVKNALRLIELAESSEEKKQDHG